MYYEDEDYEEEVNYTTVTIFKDEGYPMYTETENQRNYLKNRLYSVFENKDHELAKKYGVADDDRPNSWEELIDRIAKGRYVLPEERTNNPYDLYAMTYVIRWRDPNLVADREGYHIVKTKMREAKQAALDKISILDPKNGLDVLNEFQTATFN